MDIGIGDLTLSAFRKVLDNPGLAPDEDFFAAGGDSVEAIQLLAAIEEELGTEIPVTLIFTYPSAAGLAEAIGAALAGARD